MRDRFIGSLGTIYPGLAAVALGAAIVEVHVTLAREMFGPDVHASVTTAELSDLVRGIRMIETMRAHPVDKDGAAELVRPLRDIFTKSVVSRLDLDAGQVLQRDHLATKKPGTGIPAARLPELVGLRLRRSLKADELLRDDDLERV